MQQQHRAYGSDCANSPDPEREDFPALLGSRRRTRFNAENLRVEFVLLAVDPSSAGKSSRSGSGD